MELKDKKVLLMGLGILGGGAATAKWLLEQGADLTVTDMKEEEHLKPSLEKLAIFKDKIRFVLGGHRERDFIENDIIVINPDVPAQNPFVELARKNGKRIENELTLFHRFCKSKNIISITGTRGKTTTVNWTAHFLKAENPDTLVVGNSTESPFLDSISKCGENTKVVLETPSFQLELLGESGFSSHICLITNIYRDHINRHKTMEAYAAAKANTFKNQTENDFLILNKDNEWTEFFLNQKPKAKILFFSKESHIDFIDKEAFKEKWGEHNLLNLSAAVLAAQTTGVSDEAIKDSIATLPQIKFREEKVFDDGKLQIYNDTAATSPEATIAAIKRFTGGGKRVLLIAGGTDRELDFTEWASFIRQNVRPEDLILLGGSATEKMKSGLNFEDYNEFGSLEGCLDFALSEAQKSAEKTVILFSPSSKSFEKFKNEFDRGEQFNLLVKKLT